MSECYKCKVMAGSDSELIKCCECNGLYHPACTKIRTMSKFEKMGDVKKTSWKCDECSVDSLSTSSGRPETQLEGISAVLAAIKETNNKIDKSHADLAAKLEANTTSLTKLHDTVEGIKQEQSQIKEDCKELWKEADFLRDESQMLRQEVRELQQYTRRENLEIAGVPFTRGEDVYEVVAAVAKCLKLKYLRSEVSVAHRVPAKNKHPTIIVRFVSRSTREAWLAAVRVDKSKRISTKDINPTLDAGSVYINEHLSPFNKMLLSTGKSLVKEKKLAYAWARDGKVFIKKTPEGKSVRVRDAQDFKNV